MPPYTLVYLSNCSSLFGDIMEAAILEILKTVPVLAVLFYVHVKSREDNQELAKRYADLVNKTIDGFSKQSGEMQKVMESNTRVMERVEAKLNEKH